jgi:tight adherence protein C
MIYILLLCLVVIGFVFVIKNKTSKRDKRFTRSDTVPNKKLENKDYKNKILEILINKIDFNKKDNFFANHNVRLKCIKAGIRNIKEQKIIVLTRHILIIPLSIITAMIAYMLYPNNTNLTIIGLFLGGILGFYYPIIRLDSVIKDRKEEIDRAFPDFVDLMMVCVEAGMPAEQAYVRIAPELQKFYPVMAGELEILSAELTYFLEPRIAYDNFLFRTQNSFVKAFCNVVLQSLEFGTPLSQGLRSLSAEIRETQMGMIERKAASLPSKLTVPMMLFTLPVLFVVILFPAAYQLMNKG